MIGHPKSPFAARRSPLAVGLALALAACGGATSTTGTPADATYTVRAEIVRLPSTAGGDLQLHHESVPEFRNARGEIVGMMAMIMPFAVDPGVDISGRRVGDRVTVHFDVRWAASQPLLVTSLLPLPDGTVLEFDPEPVAEEVPPESLAVDDDPDYAETGETETPR